MSSPPVFVKDVSAEEAVIAASNAYKVAALKGLTFLLALYMYYYRKRQEVARARYELGRGENGALSAPLVQQEEQQLEQEHLREMEMSASSSSTRNRGRKKAAGEPI